MAEEGIAAIDRRLASTDWGKIVADNRPLIAD